MRITPINLAKRVERWQKRLGPLGVAHWRIESVTITDAVPGEPGALAAVQPSESYDSVRFYFDAEFIDNCNERDLDETILHEWIHVAMRDLDVVIHDVEETLPPAAADFWARSIHHAREGLVDRLARQIYASHDDGK